MTDITILTCQAYFAPEKPSAYTDNILLEYRLLKDALERLGLSVNRTYWDDPNYDWGQTRAVVFRTIWDYFERFDEFWPWLQRIQNQTQLINPMELLEWNIDKAYLFDLAQRGIPVVPSVLVKKGETRSLSAMAAQNNWTDLVVKPTIAGGGYLTYKYGADELDQRQTQFDALVQDRDMLVQGYIPSITTRGEASLMVFGGVFTHSILKRAKTGDFRVQDDFGGSVHPYEHTPDDVALAQKVMAQCSGVPAYGRVDIVWNEHNQPMVSELEIIEPELWVRNAPWSADYFAKAIANKLSL
jgi:glutathione synthase/RimK-type ligase-like ATP-grasp enzyme